MKKLSLFLISILTVLCANAKDINVTGTVTAASDGEPLIGATVMVKGTSNGVSTDIDGGFALTAPEGSVIEFKYVGYKQQSVKVTDSTPLDIVLHEDATMLDEVVAVGYGTQRKSVVTAAISKIDDEKLSLTAPVRMDNALNGLTSVSPSPHVRSARELPHV